MPELSNLRGTERQMIDNKSVHKKLTFEIRSQCLELLL